MALQNIGAANSDDAFYRYKMPRMITKIEGRGNGIKTNVVNMVDIAKALARPPAYTTKYFGNELGAQSKFDEKTGVSLVNGAHDTSKLAGILENFIKKYVQCYGCGNPETEILITKSQMIQLKCAACGYISDVDMLDKLTTYIIKNPPEPKKGAKDKKALRRAEKERLKEGEAADEEQKKLKKDGKKKGASSKDAVAAPKAAASKKKGATNGSDEDHSASPSRSQNGDDAPDDDEEEDDGVEWQTDTSKEAAQKRVMEQLSNATAEMVMLTIDELEPKKAATVPPQKSSNGISNHHEANSGGQNGSKASAYSQLVDSIRTNVKAGNSAAQLKGYLSSVSATPQEKTSALFEALFQGVGKGFDKEVLRKKSFITAVVPDEESQMLLLHAIEAFGSKSSVEALKQVALVLKALYDEDIVEEEIIIKWYKEGISGGRSSSQVLKNAKPFVEWLENAESEEEDD